MRTICIPQDGGLGIASLAPRRLERAEAGGGGRDDQPLGISKTRRQLPVEVRDALEVARVGRD